MKTFMNVNEMRVILSRTIRGVAARRIKPQQAQTIYAGCGQLMNTYKLEYLIRKAANQKMLNVTSFLPTPKKNGKR
jgi:hypothetical protein